MKKTLNYDSARDFHEGLAAVCRDSKWGFIDTSGREVVPCKYDAVDDFHEGLARVELDSGRTMTFNSGWSMTEDSKWGYVDKTGREIIPCQYDQAYNFSDGLAKVYLSIWDPDMPEPNNPFPLPSDTKRFFIDKTGKEVLTAVEDWDVFYDGLARIKRDGKTGYVNKEGKEVIPCKYDGAAMFCEGMAIVCEIHFLPEEEWTEECRDYSTKGFIDKTGREVTPCKYDEAHDFHEGLALVKLDGKFGFIDKTGCEVIPLQNDWAGDFHEGLAKLGGQCFIDKAGQKVLDLAELGIVFSSSFSNGLAVALCEPGGKRGYIDKTGELVIPCKYDEAHDFHDDLAMVREGRTWGFIDKTGQMVIEYKTEPAPAPARFDTPDDELPF